jgi:ADP-ribose pyrophosphatase
MTSNAENKRDSEKIQESHWVYKGKIIKLRLDTYQMEEKTKVFELVDHPGAVVIVPIDPKGRLLLIRQWRRAVEEIILELPAGKLEPEEDPLFCAQRELQEEVGYKAGRLTKLSSFYSAPGFCNERLHLFVAQDLLPSTLAADDDEGIDVVPTYLPEAIQMIEDGTLADAKSIAGILHYQLWSKKHRE